VEGCHRQNIYKKGEIFQVTGVTRSYEWRDKGLNHPTSKFDALMLKFDSVTLIFQLPKLQFEYRTSTYQVPRRAGVWWSANASIHLRRKLTIAREKI